MKVLVSCVEASGDLIASGVVRALGDAQVIGLGGRHCREAGADLRWDVSELSVMGLAEVLPKLRRIWSILRGLEELARTERPDVALLVDGPDFNLRLAKRLKLLGIRVVYYVSPKLWAWRSGRVKRIRRDVDAMCCIFPFEEPWYRDRGVNATFVGHPLMELEPTRDTVAALRRELLGDGSGPLLALLPGSRGFEVRNLLPEMLGAARLLAKEVPSLEVALPLAPTVDRARIDAMCREAGFAPKLLDGRARELLGAADAALVASGTATLEAALAEVPTVVAYRASWLTELAFRLFVRMRWVSPPNILAGREVVPELLQRRANAETLAAHVRPLLADGPARRRMKEDLATVRGSLGAPGAASRVAAILGEGLLPRPPVGLLAGGG